MESVRVLWLNFQDWIQRSTLRRALLPFQRPLPVHNVPAAQTRSSSPALQIQCHYPKPPDASPRRQMRNAPAPESPVNAESHSPCTVGKFEIRPTALSPAEFHDHEPTRAGS